MENVKGNMEGVKPGLYKHYKGNIYEVIGVAKHSETLEEMVVYKATYQKEGENLWVRPLAMFTEIIVVDGKNVKRFTKIKNYQLADYVSVS